MEPHTYLVSVRGMTGYGNQFDACFKHVSSKQGTSLANELMEASEHADFHADDSGSIKSTVIIGVFDCGPND